MLLFLDTEYTGLSQPADDRKLLSLALVTEDGRAEWYAELSGWTMADCDPWVQRHVLPLMTGPSMTTEDARASLRNWFATLPRSVQAACDSPIDLRFLLDLLGKRPSNLANSAQPAKNVKLAQKASISGCSDLLQQAGSA
jgi:hypothetical protein